MEPEPLGHLVDVRIDRDLVEGVEHHGLGLAAAGRDVAGHGLELLRRAPGHDHTCAFPGEGAGHGAADAATARRR